MQKSRICIIGESWGAEEEKERIPFVGTSGYLLTKMLEEAGINRADCFLTNVINARPENNKVEAFCGDKKTAIQGWPALIKGKYLRTEFAPELERLGDELTEVNPNLIICLGNTAMWALCGKTAISKARGTTSISSHTVAGFKVLPTYHPAAVSRQWELRPITVIDLVKAKRESEFPEIRRPKREIWIEPAIQDLWDFHDRYIKPCSLLATDVETSGTQITCVGFAPRPDLALVVPFLDIRRKDRNYWPSKELESAAWKFVRYILEEQSIKKCFQNGIYDIAFFWRSYGIKTRGADEDSMLAHHALQPESLKSLGFLGSIYCDGLPAWKDMRNKQTIKQDE